MAELTPEEKDAISHRGRAARALVDKLVAAEDAARPAGPLEALFGGRKDRRSGGRTRAARRRRGR
jgi:hypothetical protein